MYDGILPCGGVFLNFREFRHQLPTHQRNIIRTGFVSVHIQSAGIDKMRFLHPQFLCLPVHPLHKGLLTACHKLCHGNRRLIRRCNRDTFRQLCGCLRFARLQKNLRSTHTRRMLAHLHRFLPFKLSCRLRFVNQQQCHHLCHAGRRHCLVTVFFIQNRSRACVHQHRTFTFQLQCIRFRRKSRQAEPKR